MLNHLGAGSVRCKKLELRFYLDDEHVIRGLKKSFVGREGKDDDFDMTSTKNIEIDYLKDQDSHWSYFGERYKKLLKLYHSHNEVF